MRSVFYWNLGSRSLELGKRTLIMGIINVTPDSFSDGGKFQDPAAAIAHAEKLLAQGADILDIGGESTRPGARIELPPQSNGMPHVSPLLRDVGTPTPQPAVSAEQELDRILPVITALKK